MYVKKVEIIVKCVFGVIVPILGPIRGFGTTTSKKFFLNLKVKVYHFVLYTLFWLFNILFHVKKCSNYWQMCFFGLFSKFRAQKWVVWLKIKISFFFHQSQNLSRFQKHFTELKNITPMLSYDQICKCLYRICFI